MYLYRVYLDATERPHGHLILDLSQETNDLRFRTNIFPTEHPPIVYTPIENKASKIKLSRPARAEDGATQTA